VREWVDVRGAAFAAAARTNCGPFCCASTGHSSAARNTIRDSVWRALCDAKADPTDLAQSALDVRGRRRMIGVCFGPPSYSGSQCDVIAWSSAAERVAS
jgi:hypothetical protein